nr:tetratricopeptide repeat protein [Parapedobacter lycopersici]
MNTLKRFCYSCLVAVGAFLPTLLLAQQELKRYDRAKYADVVYTKLGFGEVNQQLLTSKQAEKLGRRIRQIQKDYGTVIVFASLVPKEANDWKNGNLGGLPAYYLGEDPRAARNHVMILFSEEDGRNWIRYGRDNEADFTPYTGELNQLFTSKYRKPNAYRPIHRLLKYIALIFDRLDNERKNNLLHPQLTVKEWIGLARAEMDITGDYATATTHLQRAVALDSANAETLMLLGYAYLEQQDWEAAATAFRTAWSLDANFETAVGYLTLHYLRHDNETVKKWEARVQQFTADFSEKIHNVAHYPSPVHFIGNATDRAFQELFQQEIRQSKSEGIPEADVHP